MESTMATGLQGSDSMQLPHITTTLLVYAAYADLRLVQVDETLKDKVEVYNIPKVHTIRSWVDQQTHDVTV